MNDPLEAEIAEAASRLQAVLPNPADVRLDKLTTLVESGRYSVKMLVLYMQSHQMTPVDVLWKLGDMLDKHAPVEPVEPAAAIAEEPVDDDPGPDGVRPE